MAPQQTVKQKQLRLEHVPNSRIRAFLNKIPNEIRSPVATKNMIASNA